MTSKITTISDWLVDAESLTPDDQLNIYLWDHKGPPPTWPDMRAALYAQFGKDTSIRVWKHGQRICIFIHADEESRERFDRRSASSRERLPFMTESTEEVIARLRGLMEKATPLPWNSDSERSEGAYGAGEDIHEGFDIYSLFGSDGKKLLDALNSDAILVHEEWDEETHHAWDETSYRNVEFVAVALNALPRLLADLEQAREALRKIADESVFNQQRYGDDTDTDYFLRCFDAVKQCARAALATPGEKTT